MGGALAAEGRAAVRAALVETWNPGAVGDAPSTPGAQARSTGAHRIAKPAATSATMPSMAPLTIDSRTAAAEERGIHPSTLYRKMRDLGIEARETDGRSLSR